jgi:hypothetical protein
LPRGLCYRSQCFPKREELRREHTDRSLEEYLNDIQSHDPNDIKILDPDRIEMKPPQYPYIPYESLELF